MSTLNISLPENMKTRISQRVTGNGDDFPADGCGGVEVVTPAAFLRDDLLKIMAHRRKNPPTAGLQHTQ